MQEGFPNTVKDESRPVGHYSGMRKTTRTEPRPNSWIEARLKNIGKSKSGLADAMKLANARITEILNGKRQVVAKEVNLMANYLEMPAAEVLANLTGGDDGRRGPPLKVTRHLIVRGALQAGVFKEAVEWPPEERYDVAYRVSRRSQKLPLFGLEIAGPSMNLKFPEGSVAICCRLMDLDGEDVQSGDYVVVYRRNELDEIEATVKQYEIDREGRQWLWPRSDHPEFQTPIEVAGISANRDQTADQDIQIWAKVIGKVEEF